MAIAINGSDGNPVTTRSVDGSASNYVYTNHKLAFSGNYATGGDTLDFTTVAGLVPTGSLPVAIQISEQGTAATPSLSAAGGYYEVIQAASPAINNYKLKIFKNTAGSVTEYSNGAYGADVTTDNVFMQVIWNKLL